MCFTSSVGTRGGRLAVEAGGTSNVYDSSAYSATAGGMIDLRAQQQSDADRTWHDRSTRLSQAAPPSCSKRASSKSRRRPAGKLSFVVENMGGTMQFDVSEGDSATEPA
jgi:hypothetical protein